MQIVNEIGTVYPVIIAEIGPDQSAAVRPMAWRAVVEENGVAVIQDVRVLGGRQRRQRVLKTFESRGFDRIADLAFLHILRGLQIS